MAARQYVCRSSIDHRDHSALGLLLLTYWWVPCKRPAAYSKVSAVLSSPLVFWCVALSASFWYHFSTASGICSGMRRGFEKTARHGSGLVCGDRGRRLDTGLVAADCEAPVMSLRSPAKPAGHRVGSAKDGTSHGGQAGHRRGVGAAHAVVCVSLLTLRVGLRHGAHLGSRALTSFFSVLLGRAAYHGYLGTIVIIEDYVTRISTKVISHAAALRYLLCSESAFCDLAHPFGFSRL